MICTKFHRPKTKNVLFGTQYKQQNFLAIFKNISKPWPKEAKRAAIELWAAKVPLAYINK
jgi:hypothetical protein